jgi:hypothetical protein
MTQQNQSTDEVFTAKGEERSPLFAGEANLESPLSDAEPNSIALAGEADLESPLSDAEPKNTNTAPGETKAESPLLDAMSDVMAELIQVNSVIHKMRAIAHVDAPMAPLALRAIDELASEGKITISGKGGEISLIWQQR